MRSAPPPIPSSAGTPLRSHWVPRSAPIGRPFPSSLGSPWAAATVIHISQGWFISPPSLTTLVAPVLHGAARRCAWMHALPRWGGRSGETSVKHKRCGYEGQPYAEAPRSLLIAPGIPAVRVIGWINPAPARLLTGSAGSHPARSRQCRWSTGVALPASSRAPWSTCPAPLVDWLFPAQTSLDEDGSPAFTCRQQRRGGTC